MVMGTNRYAMVSDRPIVSTGRAGGLVRGHLQESPTRSIETRTPITPRAPVARNAIWLWRRGHPGPLAPFHRSVSTRAPWAPARSRRPIAPHGEPVHQTRRRPGQTPRAGSEETRTAACSQFRGLDGPRSRIAVDGPRGADETRKLSRSQVNTRDDPPAAHPPADDLARPLPRRPLPRWPLPDWPVRLVLHWPFTRQRRRAGHVPAREPGLPDEIGRRRDVCRRNTPCSVRKPINGHPPTPGCRAAGRTPATGSRPRSRRCPEAGSRSATARATRCRIDATASPQAGICGTAHRRVRQRRGEPGDVDDQRGAPSHRHQRDANPRPNGISSSAIIPAGMTQNAASGTATRLDRT